MNNSETDKAAQSASFDALEDEEEGSFVFKDGDDEHQLAKDLEAELMTEDVGQLYKDLHDNERASIQKLAEQEGRPTRATRSRKKNALTMPDPYPYLGEASCSDSDETGRWSDDDRTGKMSLIQKYGLLQTGDGTAAPAPKHATQEDLDFVAEEPKSSAEPQESESYVPSDEEEERMDLEKVFQSALLELLKTLPEGMTVSPYEDALKTPFPILFADAKDFQLFRNVCGKLYAEILEGPSSSTRKISVSKEMNDTFKASDELLKKRMVQIGINVMSRVSALNSTAGNNRPLPKNGKPRQSPIHPWHITWQILTHAAHIEQRQEPVELPEEAGDGIPCAVTGKMIKPGEECYMLTVIRKNLGGGGDKLLQSFHFVSKAPGRSSPELYATLILSCWYMWNYRGLIQDWMRKWDRDNPMVPSSTSTEDAVKELYESERGKARLARLYARFKMRAALPEIMLNKVEE